ncbi:hypothetical protein AVEN_192930-1 [Araneus ventricosus]|uniref:Uncharacterized protein n=1 Tax=Araneus ventricosus TaxID=182803 RepID=A0A4Y2JBH1_ARAVE|nr:hypothetical protein AVEN_192930-1 [Araneus ventricosus]
MGEHPNGMLLICQVSSRIEFPKSCPLLVRTGRGGLVVVAVLILETGLINCDGSQTIKGVHKHTFLIYTETKSKKNDNVSPIKGTSAFGLDNIEWPNTEYGDTKWSFTESDNAKQFNKNSDGWKWSDKASSPLEWSDMGSLNLNKQGMQTGGIQNFGQNIKQTEEFDDMRKLMLGIDNGRPASTPNKVNGIKNLRPIIDSEDMKKMLIGVEELPQKENESGEEDDESEEGSNQQSNSNSQGQEEKNKEQAITVRKIKTKPLMGSPQLCPEDVMYLEHMLGMRPMKYKFIEMGTFGNQQSRRSRKQSLVSGIKSSDTRNIRTRNKIRVTRRPLMQKLRSLSIFRNNGD